MYIELLSRRDTPGHRVHDPNHISLYSLEIALLCDRPAPSPQSHYGVQGDSLRLATSKGFGRAWYVGRQEYVNQLYDAEQIDQISDNPHLADSRPTLATLLGEILRFLPARRLNLVGSHPALFSSMIAIHSYNPVMYTIQAGMSEARDDADAVEIYILC